MPRNYQPRGLRAPKGSVGRLLVVSVPPELFSLVGRMAADARITRSQWVRNALMAYALATSEQK